MDRTPLFLSLHFNALHWPWEGHEDKAISDPLQNLRNDGGDWKYLKLGKREWLFNLAEDEHKRANYAAKEPARTAALKQAWTAWNDGMLPYPVNSLSGTPSTPDWY